jgi:outer membrane protein OmpA-like peptidoglycan-associated protein
VERQPAPRFSQVGFGRSAYFATCVVRTCPALTPKQLASTPIPGATAAPLVSRFATEPSTVPAANAPVARMDEAGPTHSAKYAPTAAQARLTLHFKSNAAQLTAAHKAELDRALPQLRLSDLVVIAGRTDDMGSETANQTLATARSLAVRDHLLDLDPDLPARITIDARGRCCYAATNDSNLGRSRNRRVDIAYRRIDRGAP